MPTVLLTGFEPFENEPLNPSWEAVRRLEGEVIAGHTVVSARLPVVFGAALESIEAALEATRPALAIAVGQAKGIAGLQLERVALNLDDARIPDNAGRQPVDTPVIANAPTAYLTTLPVKAMMAALLQAGIPAHVSQSAGTFVCNHVFYGLRHLAESRPGLRAGFIHIPLLPEQAVRFPGTPSMTLEQAVAGLRLAVETALRTERDISLTAGSLHG